MTLVKRIKEQYFFIRQRANPQTRKIHSANTPLSLFRLQRYDMKKPLSSSTPPFDSFIGQAEQLTHILPKDNNYRLFDYRYKRAHSPNSSPDSIKEFLFDPYIFIYIYGFKLLQFQNTLFANRQLLNSGFHHEPRIFNAYRSGFRQYDFRFQGKNHSGL